MFTGLIQSLGTLHFSEVEKVQISCPFSTADGILQDLAIGDSVAVDGVCLTVVEILPRGFVAAASPETLQRTTLSQQQIGETYVNLEASLRVGSKLGGHFVTGHVDGIGYLQEAVQTASSWEMRFTVKATKVARYIVPKGSITVNGISLTVADCDPGGTWFTVAVIPHTFAETNLRDLRPGSWVNLEGDILGKYVEKFLRLGPGSAEGSDSVLELGAIANMDTISPTFLAEHGYF
jgi:riboflavin synthase